MVAVGGWRRCSCPLCVRGQGVAGCRDLDEGIVCPQGRSSGRPKAALSSMAWLYPKFLEPLGVHVHAGYRPWELFNPGHRLTAQNLHICLGSISFFMSEFQLVKFYSSRELVTFT